MIEGQSLLRYGKKIKLFKRSNVTITISVHQISNTRLVNLGHLTRLDKR